MHSRFLVAKRKTRNIYCLIMLSIQRISRIKPGVFLENDSEMLASISQLQTLAGFGKFCEMARFCSHIGPILVMSHRPAHLKENCVPWDFWPSNLRCWWEGVRCHQELFKTGELIPHCARQAPLTITSAVRSIAKVQTPAGWWLSTFF